MRTLLLLLAFGPPALAQSSVATSLGTLTADHATVTYTTLTEPERTISRDLLALGRFDVPETWDAENVRMLLTSSRGTGADATGPAYG